MPDDFQVVLVEGVFYLDNNKLYADNSDVESRLSSLAGRRVHFAAHHLPAMPPDPQAWGGGCCFWAPTGHCPYGHHAHPSRLFSIVAEGVLLCEDTWFIEHFNGQRTSLGIEGALPGHRGRIAAATALTVEQMREAAAQSVGDASVLRAADLSAVLERLRRGTQ